MKQKAEYAIEATNLQHDNDLCRIQAMNDGETIKELTNERDNLRQRVYSEHEDRKTIVWIVIVLTAIITVFAMVILHGVVPH